jgi:DNA-binding GntR family transcriptional regulator
MDELRKTYNVGLSPLREALMRLEAEDLVALEQNKGFRVSPVSREHLLDVGRMRAEIESLALKWAIEKGDVFWEADILSAFHRLSRQSKIDEDNPMHISKAWNKEHRGFHSALVAACGSPILLSMLESLFDQAERYVALSIINLEKPRNDVSEHEGLMQATLARDAKKACTLCREHTQRTTDKVASSIYLQNVE